MLKLLTLTIAIALAGPALALGPIPDVPSTWPIDSAFDKDAVTSVSTKGMAAPAAPKDR